MPAPDTVLTALEGRFDQAIDELCALSRIPGISAAPEGNDGGVVRSAHAVAELLQEVGFADVEVASPDAAPHHPYVVGGIAVDPKLPTVLLYAHHDVQPIGRASYWNTPAFEPTLRDDGRLYGRGVVDDKAGILVFAAAVRAWREAEGGLPLNVKVIVEGEEEIGSVHLADCLRAERERLQADVIVLSDTANLDTGIPSITTSLRGLASVDVTVKALDHPLHSGMWGGPVPDAASALGIVLGRLFDERGRPAIPGLEDDLPPLADAERAALEALPFDEAAFRRDAGIEPGVGLAGDPATLVYERLWRRPSVAVTALEGVPLADAANQLIAEAKARVGVRLAPGQDPARVTECVVAHLRRDPPWGVTLEVEAEQAVAGWSTVPEGPAFDAARRALAAGYEREAAVIGCGGSIPFVGPFSEVLGGAPALLLGLEDPICNAHGENESLHVGDFRKAARSAAHLLDELARG